MLSYPKFIFIFYLSATIVLAAVPPYGRLSVNNGKLLRGGSLWFSQWLTEFYSPNVVRAVKCTFNSNVIRAAIGPEANGYFDNLDQAVNAATNGIYFVVDLHYGFQNCDKQDEFEGFTNKAIEFFTRILGKFKGSPNLLLELWNEPQCTWDKISEYHSKVLKAIRNIDSNVVCILGTPNASSGPSSEVVSNPLRVSNTLYTMHWYAVKDQAHINSQYHLIDNAIKNNIGVFVSEYGDADVTPGATVNIAATTKILHFLDVRKISYMKWSFCNRDEVWSVIKPECGAGQINQPECLSPSGQAFLKRFKNLKNGRLKSFFCKICLSSKFYESIYLINFRSIVLNMYFISIENFLKYK
ncbi:unnamed protein product [Meloidogyne enterolobii]|uniref:Uncharacterized protein n=2 Tax=Meloidogyne enterolobii TaxID=390850 RepID=A0ACB1B737_MELEN